MIFDKIKKTPKVLLFYTYILLQLIFYILLYTTDIFIYHIGCYSVIICGLIIGIFIYLKYRIRYTYLIVFAQFFTLLSDTFLVLLDNHYILALISFLTVQIIYYIYILSLIKFKLNLTHKILFSIRILICMVIFILFIFIKDIDFLVFLAITYFCNLCFNFISSIFTFKHNMLLPFGFFLFILCDICVGCYNIIDMINIEENSIIYIIANAKINLSWIFYHPSQVILSLSGMFDKA